MDLQTFAGSMGNSVPLARYAALLPAWNAALIQAGCTTVNRVAMITAQVGEESGGLRWMEEIASGAAYEGDLELGNTQPGDGERFKGHGPLQITGRANHLAVSKWAFAKGYVPTPTYFVDNPEQLAGDQYGFLGVVWYWTVARPQLNADSDAGNVEAATRAVNGGENGLADRTARWKRALTFGTALLPEDYDLTPEEHDMLSKVLTLATTIMAQLAGEGSDLFTPGKEWTGWPTWTNGTNERLTLVDLGRRENVEMAELRAQVQAIADKLGVTLPPPPAPAPAPPPPAPGGATPPKA